MNVRCKRDPWGRVVPRLLVALSSVATASAWAKIDVPYGPNGEPPDSETQAEVAALNDALEGPDEGESPREWEIRLEHAYEDLYETEADFSDVFPSGVSWPLGLSNQCEPPADSDDLCWTPLSAWIDTSDATSVYESLASEQTREDLQFGLGVFVQHMLAVQAAGSDVVIERPRLSVQCNTCAPSAAAIDVEVPFRLVAQRTIPGLPLGSGEVSAEADIFIDRSHGYDQWCVDFRRHSIAGLSFINLLAHEQRLDAIFGSGPYCAMWSAVAP